MTTLQKVALITGITGQGVNEAGYWNNHLIIKIDPRYFRPTEVETLLDESTKAKDKFAWMPEITLDQMIAEMVTCDLELAKQHALLKQHGYNINVSFE